MQLVCDHKKQSMCNKKLVNRIIIWLGFLLFNKLETLKLCARDLLGTMVYAD